MENLLAFLSYIFISAYTPGPNNILAMSTANKIGLKGTLGYLGGVGAGFSLVMLACAAFNVALYSILPTAKFAMSVLGAAYMFYLAWKTLKSDSHDRDSSEEKRSGFMAGMILQFLNPKIILYGITAISSFILPQYDSPLMLFLFCLLLTAVGISGCFTWALFGAVFQKALARYQKQFNIVMSLLLVYCGIAIIVPLL